ADRSLTITGYDRRAYPDTSSWSDGRTLAVRRRADRPPAGAVRRRGLLPYPRAPGACGRRGGARRTVRTLLAATPAVGPRPPPRHGPGRPRHLRSRPGHVHPGAWTPRSVPASPCRRIP